MAGYQVMPRLSPERYAALEADIIANGVQDPIKVSEAGVIVDGHHRDEIARKHDLHCPRVVVKGDDAYLRDRAYTWNGARRDLTAEERREVAEKSLRSDPILRDSDHARRTGMDRKTVKRIRESLGIPTPDDVIREYAEAHPDMPNYRVAKELGVSEGTVKSVRDSQKRDIPEFEKKSKPTARVGSNEETPEWEEVGNIPQSRLNNLTPAPGFNPGDLEELNTTTEPPEPAKPRRTPITDDANRIGREIRKAAEKLAALTEDDRYTTSKEKVTPLVRGHLQYVIEIATNVLDDLTTPEE